MVILGTSNLPPTKSKESYWHYCVIHALDFQLKMGGEKVIFWTDEHQQSAAPVESQAFLTKVKNMTNV